MAGTDRDISGFVRSFSSNVGGLLPFAELFDSVPDIVLFVKDAGARYVAVNRTLVSRCGLPDKQSAIGRTAAELFPAPMAEAFLDQDQEILSSGKGFTDRLELHLYPGGKQGWCLTCKQPVRADDGTVIGLCGLSRDLGGPGVRPDEYAALSKVIDHIRKNHDEPLRLPALARMAGMSVYQFDQRIRSLFHVTAGQYLVKVRIDAACERLASTDQPIVEIALGCGYSDQSSFSRQFKQAVGLSPLAYRKQTRVVPG